jgi:phosphoribosylglycinamide formyltransferase 1
MFNNLIKEKILMSQKLKIGVLGSTKGTDLQAVIDAIEEKKIDAEIAVVISDVQDAFILERAKKHGIEAKFVDPKAFESREAFNTAILQILEKKNVELVLLIGYMRIVREPIISAFKNRMMNIHPSLLPKYAGGKDTNVHEEVLKNGDTETGCTLHFVTADIDSGPIIMQKKVAVEENDDVDSLKEKVQEAEKEIILKAIGLFAENKIKVENGMVKILE